MSTVNKINGIATQTATSPGTKRNIFFRFFEGLNSQKPRELDKPVSVFNPNKPLSEKEYQYLKNHTHFQALNLSELRERYMEMAIYLGAGGNASVLDEFVMVGKENVTAHAGYSSREIIEELMPFIEGMVQRAEELGGLDDVSLKGIKISLQGRANALKDSGAVTTQKLYEELDSKIKRLEIVEQNSAIKCLDNVAGGNVNLAAPYLGLTDQPPAISSAGGFDVTPISPLAEGVNLAAKYLSL